MLPGPEIYVGILSGASALALGVKDLDLNF